MEKKTDAATLCLHSVVACGIGIVAHHRRNKERKSVLCACGKHGGGSEVYGFMLAVTATRRQPYIRLRYY
jgi:hypothetical protein